MEIKTIADVAREFALLKEELKNVNAHDHEAAAAAFREKLLLLQMEAPRSGTMLSGPADEPTSDHPASIPCRGGARPGAGRPPKSADGPRVELSLTVSPTAKEALQRAALEAGVSRSELVDAWARKL